MSDSQLSHPFGQGYFPPAYKFNTNRITSNNQQSQKYVSTTNAVHYQNQSSTKLPQQSTTSTNSFQRWNSASTFKQPPPAQPPTLFPRHNSASSLTQQQQQQKTLSSNNAAPAASHIQTYIHDHFSLSSSSSRWRPNQSTGGSQQQPKLIGLTTVPRTNNPTSTVSKFQLISSADTRRMPEVEIALKQLLLNIQTSPKEGDEIQEPITLKEVQLHPYQRYALAWMNWREQTAPSGGILADDMGLGKTVTTVAFILYRMESSSITTASSSTNEKLIPTTLIVVPATLMHHWEAEIDRLSSMRCYIYHGSSRKREIERGIKFKQYDVVLTSYEIVRSEYGQQTTAIEQSNPLFSVKWTRVILDEAHRIRSHTTQTAHACVGLVAIYRWCLTGTPIHNKADDFYSLLKFLHYEPFDIHGTWKIFISNKEKFQERMKCLVSALLLRRTKQDKNHLGQPLVPLPSRTVVDIWLNLCDVERNYYEKIRSNMTSTYQKFLRLRQQKQKTNTVVLFTLMLKLRQACNHLSLVQRISSDDGQDVLDEVKKDVDLELSMFNLDLNDTLTNDENIQNTQNDMAKQQFDQTYMSTKLKCLLDKLNEIVKQKQEKCIVVSSWVGMLDIIRFHLHKKLLIRTSTISGQVKISERQQIVKQFNDSNDKLNMVRSILSLFPFY
ncbi:unnamed protein product [Didymodactylos carnosus]|uniref:Helicase ATP-binding domain-containing protein n=1 Tax=Didymodactylos carnosus TaxID=1234261 RepID=A0A815HWK9_9BILA|nr:unnamed protein product [Didymodactylos carnosus]CAF1357994.1 unnamed protein product [Didymodactylos carnosus]CAF4009079.1 unnamed protein product [Didymodactylos carnosus]CAF4233729.1 unnamed protein product [Didymodactylos carnosus]